MKSESSFLLSSPAVVTMSYRSCVLLSRKRTFRIGTEKAESTLAPTVVSRGFHMGIKEFIYEIRNRNTIAFFHKSTKLHKSPQTRMDTAFLKIRV